MARPTNSADSLNKASESRDSYSGHGDAAGAAGVKDDIIANQGDSLDKSGESGLITPNGDHFDDIHITLSWNDVISKKKDGFLGVLGAKTREKIDLDLGCFFELKNGVRGILQPFGNLFGAFNEMPYIELSADVRTGKAKDGDEYIRINGVHWNQVERVLVYSYIYEGASDWADIAPIITIDTKTGTPITATPSLKSGRMTVCALASLKNVKDAMQIVTHGEYFTSQASMDRAFGFGLEWEDGEKS